MESKKYFLLISLLLLFLGVNSCRSKAENFSVASFEYPQEALQSSFHLNFTAEQSIICLGTSITNGKEFNIFGGAEDLFGTTTTQPKPDSSYPGLLQKQVIPKVINLGFWGARCSDLLKVANDSIDKYNPGLVLLEACANEFLLRQPAANAKQSLDSLLDKLARKNIPVIFLEFYHPDMLTVPDTTHVLYKRKQLANEYFQMIRQTMGERGLIFVPNIYKNIWGNKQLMSVDKLHPNNAGNVRLCENILISLHTVFEVNNLLK